MDLEAPIPLRKALFLIMVPMLATAPHVEQAHLRSELQSLKLSTLQAHAFEMGATTEEVDGALDEDEPKVALAELIMTSRSASEELLPTPTAKTHNLSIYYKYRACVSELELLLQCLDDRDFTDMGGWKCYEWRGYNCTAGGWGVMSKGIEFLVARCPFSCGRCPVTTTTSTQPNMALQLQNFTIMGASEDDEAVNGVWFPVGSLNGKPVYQNMAGSLILSWEDRDDWAFQFVATPGQPKWTIRLTSGASHDDHYRYHSTQDTSTPPVHGWIPNAGKASGDITLMYQFGRVAFL